MVRDRDFTSPLPFPFGELSEAWNMKLLDVRRWEIGNNSLYQINHRWIKLYHRYGNAVLVVNSEKPKKSYLEYCCGLGI